MVRGRQAPIVAVFVLLVAGCDGTAVSPELTDVDPAFARGGATVSQTVSLTGIGGPVDLSGSATLTRNAKGLWLEGNSPDLVDGHAYTVWAAIFDNPHGCDGPCDGTDLDNRSAQATISNFGGFVADASGDFEIHLDRHDASRQTLGGVGRSGVDNPLRAEAHFIFRSHGEAEADPGDLAEQTSMVTAFCNLPPGTVCEDHGLAVFLPPGAPGQG